MLRKDTLKLIQEAIARGEPVSPAAADVRVIEHQARRLRAQTMRQLCGNAFAWLFRHRDLVVPASKIDIVRGH